MSTRQEEANITYQVTHSGVTHTGVTHTGVSHTQVTHNQVTQDPNPPTHQQIWSHKDNQSHQVQESGFENNKFDLILIGPNRPIKIKV